jgi:tetrapyrrole methylase family protein/MazG family protein
VINFHALRFAFKEIAMDFALVTSTFEILRLMPPSKLTLLEAHEFTSRHYPFTPPDVDALILGIDSPELAAQIKNILLAVYPDDHKVLIVHDGKREEKNLGDLSLASSLYVPSLGQGTSFESFAEIVAHLRAPNGCPWDREQTHQTLRTHLLEEAYETLSAMDTNDVESMHEEFGDLFLQVLLNSQIASEANEFTITNVIKNINDKLIRRHPHVFGDVQVDGVNGVLQNWEKLKEKERGGKKAEKGILDGVPAALPALIQAQEYQDRAARVGFDWPQIDGVLDKIREEIEEIKKAETDFELASEIGDLFFVLVNLARWKHVDAESVLRGTNLKFKKRFAFVEQGAKKQERNLSDMTLDEMDALWNEAKKAGI